MGSFFSGSAPQIAAPDYSGMQPLQDNLYGQMNNNSGRGPATAGQAEFQYTAGQALANTLMAQNAQRGVRASQLASMGNNAMANQISQLSGQAAIRDAQERKDASNTLANIMLSQQGQISDVNAANQKAEMEARAGQDKMIGMGLTAAGTAFGGPAGGLVTGGLTSGMGENTYATPYVAKTPYSNIGFGYSSGGR